MPMQFQGPWWPASGPLQDIMHGAMNTPGLQYFPGNTVAGLNPYQLMGAQNLLNAAGGQQHALGQAYGAWGQALNMDPLKQADPANDPYVQAMLDKNSRVVNQNLQEQVLPALTHGSVATDTGMANSAKDLAGGVAAGQASKALANANQDVLSNAYRTDQAHNLSKYQSDLAARGQAMGMTGNMMNAFTMPGSTQSRVGDFFRNYDQSLINAAKDRWNFQQNEPWNQLRRQMGIVGPIGNMGSTGQFPSQDGGGGSPWGSLLGAGLTAAGMFFGGPVGGAVGAGLGSMFQQGSASGGYGPWGTGGI